MISKSPGRKRGRWLQSAGFRRSAERSHTIPPMWDTRVPGKCLGKGVRGIDRRNAVQEGASCRSSAQERGEASPKCGAGTGCPRAGRLPKCGARTGGVVQKLGAGTGRGLAEMRARTEHPRVRGPAAMRKGGVRGATLRSLGAHNRDASRKPSPFRGFWQLFPEMRLFGRVLLSFPRAHRAPVRKIPSQTRRRTLDSSISAAFPELFATRKKPMRLR